MNNLNKATVGPDWDCPNCQCANFAVREICRNCGFDSNCGEFP